MRKVTTIINPNMYNKYKGLQNYLDYLIRAVAIYNFRPIDFNLFIDYLSTCAEIDTSNIIITKIQDGEYMVKHRKNSDCLGYITTI